MVGMPAEFNLFGALELWFLDLMIRMLSHSTMLRQAIRACSGKRKLLVMMLVGVSLLLGILSGVTLSQVWPA